MAGMSLDGMISSRDSRSVLKHRILGAVASARDRAIFSFEGTDDKIVYARWIRRLREAADYEPFIAEGKRNNRTLSWIISEDQGDLSERVSIFVDRDYDDLTDFSMEARIFMTDRYAIENYLACDETFVAVLEDDFPLHGDPITRDQCQTHFRERFQEVQDALVDVNLILYVAAQERFRRKSDESLSVNQFLDYGFDFVRPIDFQKDDLFELGGEEIEKLIPPHFESFNALPMIERHRGKFYYSFFCKYLSDLAAHCKAGSHAIFGGVARPGVKSNEITLGGLAARSPVPSGLKAFLDVALT